MNTPAHLVLNAAVLGHGRWRPHWLPITVGAVLPDVPMVAFYIYQRLVLATPERVIWTVSYYQPHWQSVFDLFNSLPLIGLGALAAWRFGAHGWLGLFASMALHGLADLPLHNDDAHAHFYPVSSWRFESPVSYWDARHYGSIVAALETALVVVGTVVLVRRRSPPAWRKIGIATLLVYAGFLAIAWLLWGSADLAPEPIAGASHQ